MSEVYQMTVDLNVLEHLGINLYSNIAAVLTEAVANAWDADATNVEISIDTDQKLVTISDDGVGMSINEMNEKYLRVGYRRREEDSEFGKYTAKGRHVMGRKGLGKLSLFSIADEIDVQSVKSEQRHGLRMTVDGIRKSVENKEPCYRPIPLSDKELTVSTGTTIILRKVKRDRLGRSASALRKRLARRFSIVGEKHEFKITIDGTPITPEDRGDLQLAQFLWTFGDFYPDAASIPKVVEREKLSNRINTWDQEWNVTGWLGTARLPKDLDSDEEGNLNSIVVFARGRLFHENILDKVNDGRIYTKYLTGQIEANFLDDDTKPDIATSDRQRVQEDDERYIQLLQFLRSSLTRLENRWSEWRRKHEVKKAKQMSPALAEWLDSLPERSKGSAENMISKISALPLDEEDDRKLMYRHGIFAFERMRLRESTEEFVASIDQVEKLLAVLSDRDALEAGLYRDIVRSRLEAIKDFQGVVDEDAKEKALQKYLFDHLWLLDPAWERATGSELMESRLMSEGVITEDLTEKDKLGRVDIAYRTNAGKHIIVELKRANRKMKLSELFEQGQQYSDKLKKLLVAQGNKSPNIEVVFVLGRVLDEEEKNPERIKHTMDAIAPGSRVKYYDSLIQGAQEAYSEYLEKSKELDKLQYLVDQI